MQKKIKITLAISIFICFAAIIALYMNRPKFTIKNDNIKIKEVKGITFEGIGENSILNNLIKKNLEKKFGNDVSESWTPLKFEDFTPNFYKTNLSQITPFIKALESKDIKEKSGENSIKMKFPYAHKNTGSFKKVNLTFSGFSKNPLLFKIEIYKPKEIISGLIAKFGNPEKILFENKEYIVWEKDNSKLISSIEKDRFNEPYIAISIYYLKNISDFFNEISPKQPDSNTLSF